jgi:beta-lactamase regulating signal transducer with metallopeptidase domain
MPSLGTSLVLIAVGAILRWAVSASTSGVSLPTIGLILLIVGIVGAVLSLLYLFAWPGHGYRAPGRVVERDPYREPPAF